LAILLGADRRGRLANAAMDWQLERASIAPRAEARRT
jgi:hypothetical protein